MLQFPGFRALIGAGLTCIPATAAVTLHQAYEAALTHSENYRSQQEAVIQAEEKESQALGNFLPSIQVTAGHTISQAPPAGFEQFAPQHQTSVAVGLVQPLFRGTTEYAALRGVRHRRAAVEANRDQARLELFKQVGQAYFMLLADEQSVRTIIDQLEIQTKRVTDIEQRKRRGESSQSELLSAQGLLTSTQADLDTKRANVENSRGYFHLVTGLDRSSELADPQLLKATAVEPLESYLKSIEQRPDVVSAHQNYLAAQDSVAGEWGGHLPNIDLAANYYPIRPGFMNNLKWDVGARLSFNLFQGGKISSAVREAISRRTQAELALAFSKRSAEQQIRELHQTLRSQVDRLEKLKHAVMLSEKNVRVVQQDYKRGLVRSIDVQQALGVLRSSRQDYDQAHFASQLDYLKLQLAAARAPQTGELSK